MDIPDNWTEALTLGLAFLGAALGIMNTWQAISAGRVKLRVKPAYALGLSGQTLFSIEVVNLSTFPVIVAEIGFTMDGNTVSTQRAAVVAPLLPDGGAWPRRLESREAVSCYFDPRDMRGSGGRLGRAYARTACGEVDYGTSPAAEQLKELLDS